MLRHLLQRTTLAIFTLWVLVSAVFLLSRILPGTFGEQQILQADEGFYGKGMQLHRTAAYEQYLKRTQQNLPLFYFGLAPIVTDAEGVPLLLPALNWNGVSNQYHAWVTALFKGSLGESLASSRPVTAVIWEATGSTFAILLVSISLTVLFALTTGIGMAYGEGAKWSNSILSALIVLDCLPLFVLSLLLLLLLANPDTFQLFPVFGLGYSFANEQGGLIAFLYQLPYLILPVLCLVLVNLPYVTSQFYHALTGTLQSNYIKTARAKGLSPHKVITRHALRNALLPVITILTDMLPVLVAGTVVTETIFAIPGIGRLLVTSVLSRDFPVIVGIVVVIAIVKIISHVLADLLYSLADPRIKHTAK